MDDNFKWVAILGVASPPRFTECGLKWTLDSDSDVCGRPGIELEIITFLLQCLKLKPKFVQSLSGYGRFNGTHGTGMVGLLYRNKAEYIYYTFVQSSQSACH